MIINPYVGPMLTKIVFHSIKPEIPNVIIQENTHHDNIGVNPHRYVAIFTVKDFIIINGLFLATPFFMFLSDPQFQFRETNIFTCLIIGVFCFIIGIWVFLVLPLL